MKADYPTLHKIAMDYLPVQASSVPSERAFSSASETDTRRRNRIRPELMEMIQLLKHLYNRTDFDMMVDELTPDIMMVSDHGTDEYLLQNPQSSAAWGDAVIAILTEDDPDLLVV